MTNKLIISLIFSSIALPCLSTYGYTNNDIIPGIHLTQEAVSALLSGNVRTLPIKENTTQQQHLQQTAQQQDRLDEQKRLQQNRLAQQKQLAQQKHLRAQQAQRSQAAQQTQRPPVIQSSPVPYQNTNNYHAIINTTNARLLRRRNRQALARQMTRLSSGTTSVLSAYTRNQLNQGSQTQKKDQLRALKKHQAQKKDQLLALKKRQLQIHARKKAQLLALQKQQAQKKAQLLALQKHQAQKKAQLLALQKRKAQLKAQAIARQRQANPVTRSSHPIQHNQSQNQSNQKKIIEQRISVEKQRAAQQRIAAEKQRAVQQRLAAEKKRAAQQRIAAEKQRATQQRIAAEKQRSAQQRLATEKQRVVKQAMQRRQRQIKHENIDQAFEMTPSYEEIPSKTEKPQSIQSQTATRGQVTRLKTPKTSELLTAKIKCGGTSPFWRLHIDMNTRMLDFKLPGDNQVYIGKVYALSSKNNEVISTISGGRGQTPVLASLNKTNNCSDGITNVKYPYTIQSSIGKRKVSGCCSLLLN